jgi:hypothetical protein
MGPAGRAVRDVDQPTIETASSLYRSRTDSLPVSDREKLREADDLRAALETATAGAGRGEEPARAGGAGRAANEDEAKGGRTVSL